MEYHYVLYEASDGVARITLNRPEKLNALSREMVGEILGAAKEAEVDPGIHVLVIRGAGRAFSSGYDITHGMIPPGTPYNMRSDIAGLQRMAGNWGLLWNLRKPVIAQVHGYCLAGGTDLAFNCDMVVAAEDAVIGIPVVRSMGSPPTHMWTYLAGPQWAKWFYTTGNSVDGRTAERIGLVLKAVPAEQLEQEVTELAKTIAQVPCDLLAAHKSLVNKALELMGRTLLQQLAAETDAIAHNSAASRAFDQTVAQSGLHAALEERDKPFADNLQE